jgi:hypothetical protein
VDEIWGEIMPWVPMFAAPSIWVVEPVEIEHLALAYAEDSRVKALAGEHANFRSYLDQFTTEFGDKVLPSLLIWDDAGSQTYRNTEALAAFRDALAVSVIPYAWARSLRFEQPSKLCYSNWFSIYPWMIDKNYEYVVMRNSALFGLHETKLLRAQTYPGLSQEIVRLNDVDKTLHKDLMSRWKRRFTTEPPEWDDVKLFRSLTMAMAAASLPSHGDFTPYDAGRLIALWVSAFEILAHPGAGKTGLVDVYKMLESAKWNLSDCKDEKYEVLAPKHARKKRILACWIYNKLYAARNDYLHGNPVIDDDLIVKESKRVLLNYAAVLYRMALTGVLDLHFKEPAPSESDTEAFDAYEGRHFQFRKYQTDMEAALATIMIAIEEQRKRSGRPAGLTSPATSGS